jgi:inhibitor of KinA sporulation pathway (predicted exonuclease)
MVVDLEATTSRDGSVPKDEMETIEIGAVLVRAESLEPEAEFATLVRPVRHPVLTAFCTQLTTITQAMVAEAPLFPAAMAAFARQMPLSEPGVVFCSWGEFDRRQLERDCAYHGVPYPLPVHLNLKRRFSESLGSSRRVRRRGFGVAEALAVCHLEFEGTAHRGLDDARNIARLLPRIARAAPESAGQCYSPTSSSTTTDQG